MQSAMIEVDNPAEYAERVIHPKIKAIRALRDDPLGQMHARGQISDMRYAAAREYQATYEAAGIGRMAGMATEEPVDGSRRVRAGVTDRQMQAARRRAVWRDMLGGKPFALLEAILIDKMPLADAASMIYPGDPQKYVGWLFRRSLDAIAADIGLTSVRITG